MTLVEKGVAPKSDFVCVTADAGLSVNRYETDTHSDGTCPAVTKPKRPMAGFVIILGTIQTWSYADNLQSAAVWAPVCMTAPMPLGLVNGEIVNTDYTAVSGTAGYPYAAGDKWTYNSTGNAEVLGDCISETATTPHTVEVVAVDVSVTVPAGTFTDCVEYVDTAEGATGSTTTWWSPTVQNAVKVVESESYAPGVQTQELASYDLK
jgi:hypothetical protein